MVIHQDNSLVHNTSVSALDMPRRFNEYKQSRKRGEDCRQSNMSSNRGEKGRENDGKSETEAHLIGRKEMM